MRAIERAVASWPVCLFWGGLGLFWAACLSGDRLPVEAVLVGPLAMFAGIVAAEYNRRA